MNDSEAGTVEVRQHGSVTELVLNRPETLNSINHEMAGELQRLLDRIGHDSSTRCLVISGAGRAFCSGQALGDGPGIDPLPADIAHLVRTRYVPLIRRIRELPCLVVAAVNGVAAGAGFSLALAADLRVASDEAWFTCAFARLGLVPDSGASWLLPRYIGYARAMELAVTGRKLTAAEALELGLVSRVYPSREFGRGYHMYAEDLAAGPTEAFALTKQAFNESFAHTLPQQLELEAQLQQRAAGTHDFTEGVSAFRQRRQPRFQGR